MVEQGGARCGFKFSGEMVCAHGVSEDQERCILHRRERTPEEVKELGAAIDDMLKAKNYDFRGVVFPEEFRRFVHARFEGPVNFDRARFQGSAEFLGAQFDGDARFNHVLIRGNANFSAARFGGNADFLRATVGGDARFTEAELEGAALFSALEVAGALQFANARVASLVQLGGARIGGVANFGRCEIGGAASFAHTRFGEDVDFTGVRCGGDCDLAYVCVEGELKLGGIAVDGDLSLRSAHLGATAFLRGAVVKGSLRLRGAHAVRNVIVSESDISGDAEFERMDVGGRTYFLKTRFGGDASFRAVNVGRFIQFAGASFGGRIEMRGATLPPAGDFRRVGVKTGLGESFCRFAKQVCQNMGEYREAGDWHYSERCHSWYARSFLRKGGARTLAMLNPMTWLEFIVGRLVFGYGENPTNVVLSALVVIVGCTGAYYELGGLVHSASGDVTQRISDAMYFSVVTFTTLGFGDYSPVAGSATRYVAMGEAMAGTFLMALFVVTLARRWGRG